MLIKEPENELQWKLKDSLSEFKRKSPVQTSWKSCRFLEEENGDQKEGKSPLRQADQEVSHKPGRKRRERTLKALGS